MANENETVMAVCAEWRDCIESADPSVWNDERIAGLVKATKAQQIAYLDRIVAAWKREKAEIEADSLAVGGGVEAARHTPGNAAEMRDALVSIREYITGKRNYIGNLLELILNWCDSALERTPRNCDVGTADEQVDRHRDWCIRDNDCSYCCNDCRNCFARWAQEGASK